MSYSLTSLSLSYTKKTYIGTSTPQLKKTNKVVK